MYRNRNRMRWREVDGGSGPVSYVGPLDLISSGTLLAAYSSRRLLHTAYSGPLARLCENGAGVEQDFSPVNGLWPVATASNFIGGNSGSYRTLFDQSGNGNHFEQSVFAYQPGYAEAGLDSGPALRFDGENDGMRRVLSSQVTTGDLWSLTVAILDTPNGYHCLTGWDQFGNPGWLATQGGEIFYNNSIPSLIYLNSNNQNRNRPRPSVGTKFYATVRTSLGKILGINGAETTAFSTSNWTIDQLCLGTRPVGSAINDTNHNWVGWIAEHYTFTVKPSDEDVAELIADVVAFYGLPS